MNINKTVRYDRVVIAQWNAFVSFVTTPSFLEGVNRNCAAALCDKPESIKLRFPTAIVTNLWQTPLMREGFRSELLWDANNFLMNLKQYIFRDFQNLFRSCRFWNSIRMQALREGIDASSERTAEPRRSGSL